MKDKKVEEINEEDDKKKSNVFINSFILIIVFIVSLFMYARYIGTSGVKVYEYRLKNTSIPENFSGVKIAYLSDILYGSVNLEEVKSIINSINERKVDLVLFGGNLLSKDYKLSKNEKKNLIELLNSIDSSLGKYAVTGNLDNETSKEILELSEFNILDNNYELIYKEGNTPICLVGVGSYLLGLYDLNSSFSYFDSNNNCYSILFTHESDMIIKILENEHKPNVIFAGGSLGGEINIPFYGPLVKFSGSSEYYLHSYVKDDVEIYVSSGVGTQKYNMRLFNRPSYNFFRLKSDH